MIKVQTLTEDDLEMFDEITIGRITAAAIVNLVYDKFYPVRDLGYITCVKIDGEKFMVQWNEEQMHDYIHNDNIFVMLTPASIGIAEEDSE